MSEGRPWRIGVDLGGTKIAITVLDEQGKERFTSRIPTPRGDYEATLRAISGLVAEAERQCRLPEGHSRIGIGMPGSVSPVTGKVQNANSIVLNGRPFREDLEELLGRRVRLANDANCLALSEAADGAATGARTVFAVILGTGCGGGLVVDGRILAGFNRAGGEWGHNPLPWARPEETPGPLCWCGRRGCLETWISGSGLQRDFEESSGKLLSGEEIVAAAKAGDALAAEILKRHADRLARGLAHVVNIFDPEVIVLGGGLSALSHLYEEVPALMKRHIFADAPRVDLRPPLHGDASGVRGAARLWDIEDDDWTF